jgi:hypothetical protein
MGTLILGDSENSNRPIDFFSRRFSDIKPLNLWLNFLILDNLKSYCFHILPKTGI